MAIERPCSETAVVTPEIEDPSDPLERLRYCRRRFVHQAPEDLFERPRGDSMTEAHNPIGAAHLVCAHTRHAAKLVRGIAESALDEEALAHRATSLVHSGPLFQVLHSRNGRDSAIGSPEIPSSTWLGDRVDGGPLQ
jgi:hypothetical protein